MDDRISPQRFQEAEGAEDWRVVGDGACTFFGTGSFAESAALVQSSPSSTGWRITRRPWTCETTG